MALSKRKEASSSSQDESNKRRKGLDWKISLDQATNFRTLVEVVSNTLHQINFKIKKEDESCFLCVDSIDTEHVCMVQARLFCEGIKLEESIDFCVDSSILSPILKNIPPHYALDLEKYSNCADVHLISHETLSNSHHTRYELPTQVNETDTVNLSEMEYKYTIEIELSCLRQIVKMATLLHSSTLTFTIREKRTDDVVHTSLNILSQGQATQSHTFFSASSSDDCQLIRAASDSGAPSVREEEMDVVFKDSFSAKYLLDFLKSMERQVVTLRLSEDKPLILNYSLGAEESYVSFVLAPKTVEE
jgi:DNA polymerase III sliding clamp (beta) subunit (PCNA family)